MSVAARETSYVFSKVLTLHKVPCKFFMRTLRLSEGLCRAGAVTIDLGLSLGFALGRLLSLVTVWSSWGLNVPHNALKAGPFSYTKLQRTYVHY